MIEGYDLLVGDGAGARQAIGRLVRPAVPFSELPPMVLSLLATWMKRRDRSEDFQSWSARQTANDLEKLFPLAGRGWGKGPNRPDHPLALPPARKGRRLPLIPENAPFSPQQRA